MNALQSLQALREMVPQAERSAPQISGWSVGMQIHHACLATSRICKALQRSSPPAPRPKFSPIRTVIFLTGRIPRGRGEAPEKTRPTPEVSQEELYRLLDEAEGLLKEAMQLDRDRWFEHFMFGPLKLRKAMRFIAIHNSHHLRIIRDICAA